jgi:WD40 repeat protein
LTGAQGDDFVAPGNVHAIAWSADGKRLAGVCPAALFMFDTTTAELLYSLPDGGVVFDWDASGELIAINIAGKGIIQIRRASDGALLKTFPGHKGTLAAVTWGPVGSQHLASAGTDGTLKIWEFAEGRGVTGDIVVESGNASPSISLAWNPAGTQVAFGKQGSFSVGVYDLLTRERRIFVPPPDDLETSGSGIIRSVAWSGDGELLAVGTGRNQITVWDARTALLLHRVSESQTRRAQNWNYETVKWIPGQRRLVIAGSESWTVWDFSGREPQKIIGITHNRRLTQACQVACSPDGKQLVLAGTDLNQTGSVTIWEIASGKMVAELPGTGLGLRAVAWSPDGKKIAAAGEAGTILLWDLATLRLDTMRGHTSRVTSVSWNPSGTQLASYARDGNAKIWDVLRQKEVLSLLVRSSAARSIVTWSPNGHQLAATGGFNRDGTVNPALITIYDATAGYAAEGDPAAQAEMARRRAQTAISPPAR